MSTKIFNAFKFSSNLDELISILKEIKELYNQICLDKIISLFKSYNYEFEKERYPFLESGITVGELKNDGMSNFILSDIFEHEYKINEHHPLNINASVVVYSFENKIYVQFFGLYERELKYLIKKYEKLFEDYHYQDSTDMSNYDWDKEKIENMSPEKVKELEEDWKERKRIWDNILPYYSAPSECGLSFDVSPNGHDLVKFSQNVLKSI